MTDEIDHANDQVQRYSDAKIKEIRSKAVIPENHTGKCLWCREPVPDKRRWCDADCRDEMENHNLV
jgi:hypothetical protein